MEAGGGETCPAATAGVNGGESELQIRSDELRSTWVRDDSSLGVVYFRCVC